MTTILITILLIVIVITAYGCVDILKQTGKIKDPILQTNEDIFNVYWTQPLTMEQQMLITKQMITKFTRPCVPNRITVTSKIAQVVFENNPCMTTEQLTIVGNKLMADNRQSNTVANVVKIQMI